MTDKKYIVFDIETTGLMPWYNDRVTCICAKGSDGKWFKKSDEDEKEMLSDFMLWVRARKPEDYQLVTQNGLQFDLPFLNTRMVIHSLKDSFYLYLTFYDHFDLISIAKKRITLDDMARLLGCKLKSGTGKGAIKLWEESKIDELIEYCAGDVEVTEGVYLKHKKLTGK